MEGIDDPETFQLSEVVEKNSKSGIFTNKRLLMIKDGFFYYFSKVPSDYKQHEPNIMSSLNELPKCSIEIRSIHRIQLESAKSSTLIINFYEKDMIDRQDIRKSISSKNYIHPIKKQDNTNQTEEWQFIFASIMKCRLWYGSLVKLKHHFVKNQDKYDKFTEYMANFDPQIRNSLPYMSRSSKGSPSNGLTSILEPQKKQTRSNTSPIPPITSPSSQQKNKFNKQEGIFQIEQMVEQQNNEEVITRQKKKSQQESIQLNNQRQRMEEVVRKLSIEEDIKVEHQQPKKQIPVQQEKEKQQSKEKEKEEQKEKLDFKPTSSKAIQNTILSPKDILKKFQSQNVKNTLLIVIESEKKIPLALKKTESIYIPQKQPQQKPLPQKPAQIQQINTQKLQEYKQKIRQQQRQKVKEEVEHYNRAIQQKQEIIKNMHEQMQLNKKNQMRLEGQIKEEQQLRLREENRMKQEYEREMRQQRERKEEEEYRRLTGFFVREEQVGDVRDNNLRSSRQIVMKQESIQTDNDRDILQVIEESIKQMPNNLHKTSRYSSKSNLSLNPLTNERQTITLFRNTISYASQVKLQTSEDIEHYDYYLQVSKLYKTAQLKERIARELALAEYIKKASSKVTDIVMNYIDSNKPKESIKIDRNAFEIEIVCDRGRIIRTEGDERLVYKNENHQRLKRTFKIYNYLNEAIIKILKKKPHFPLRVPFACFIQYKGYSVLARILPHLKQNSVNYHYLKSFGPNIPISNLFLNDFEHHGSLYSLIQPSVPFKITKEDQLSVLRLPEKQHDFISLNRKFNISLQTGKLFEQSKEIENNVKERLKYAQMMSFCRQMKKIMRANTPYLNQNQQFQYFDDFLHEPTIFMKESFKTSDQKIDGMLLYYIEKLLGLKLKAKFDKNDYFYYAIPLKRQFTLLNLDVSLFANSFDKYCNEQKYDLALKAINYSKYLQEQYSEILIKEIHLHICKAEFKQSLEKIELSLQLLSIHDPKRLKMMELRAKCYQAEGNSAMAFQCLKELLEHTQYMFMQKDRLIQVYFLIADSLSRQKLIVQLIRVYRKILQESPEHRQQILIEFSQNLFNQDTDPHIIIDFLQKQVSVENDKQNPTIQLFLGHLYYKTKNHSKALSYFLSAFTEFLQQGKRHDKIYESLVNLISCSTSPKERKQYHKQFYSKLVNTNFIYSIYCKKINTFISSKICEGMGNEERDAIINALEGNTEVQEQKLLEWGWTEGVLSKLSKKESIIFEQKQEWLGSIKQNELSQFCIYLNCPEFH